LTDLSYNDNYDEIDITDTGTSGDLKEYTGGFRDVSVQFTVILDPTASDITMNTNASASVYWEGKTYTGNMRILTKGNSGSIGSAATQQYTGRFTSDPTEAPTS